MAIFTNAEDLILCIFEYFAPSVSRNYFPWKTTSADLLVKLKKVTFPHPVITPYKKEPNVKLWYVTCQSRNVKDNLTLMLFRTNAIYVPLHLNTEGQLKKWGLVQITHYAVLSLF